MGTEVIDAPIAPQSNVVGNGGVAPNQKAPALDITDVAVKANEDNANGSLKDLTVNELPKEARNVYDGLQPNASPEQKLKGVQTLIDHSKESKEFHPNTQPDVTGMIGALLGGKVSNFLKWYNGGPVTLEQGVTATGAPMWVAQNWRGRINEYVDSNGKKLSPKERDNLLDKGGVITNSDKNALETASWFNAKTQTDLINKGLWNPVNEAIVHGQTAVQLAQRTNPNLDVQIRLLQDPKIQKIYDVIPNLRPEDRANLLQNIQKYNTLSKGSSAGKTGRTSASAGGSESLGNSANVGLGLSAKGGIPPGSKEPLAGGGLNLDAGLSGNANATNQVNVNNALSEEQSRNANATDQAMQNLQSAIMGTFAGNVDMGPEEFKKFIYINSLDALNKQSAAMIPDQIKPKGYQDVPLNDDILVGGYANVLKNRVVQQKNNALLIEFTRGLIHNNQEYIQDKAPRISYQDLNDQFSKSKIFQGIENTFNHKLDRSLNGDKAKPLPKGTAIVNPYKNNQLGFVP
jgi:hypothetical protein